jgi:hypothetical protein
MEKEALMKIVALVADYATPAVLAVSGLALIIAGTWGLA